MDASSRPMFGRLSSLHGLADMSLTDLISWGDYFKVHHPQIDAQHEAIFNLVGEVSALWHAHGSSDDLLAIVDKLDKVLRAHFRFEEATLAEIDYPRLDAHQAEHAIMLRDLKSIRCRIVAMNHGPAYPEPGWLVMNFLLGVTVGHIVHSDVDYCRFARESGIDWALDGSPS